MATPDYMVKCKNPECGKLILRDHLHGYEFCKDCRKKRGGGGDDQLQKELKYRPRKASDGPDF